jgi:hypothetical protein
VQPSTKQDSKPGESETVTAVIKGYLSLPDIRRRNTTVLHDSVDSSSPLAWSGQKYRSTNFFVECPEDPTVIERVFLERIEAMITEWSRYTQDEIEHLKTDLITKRKVGESRSPTTQKQSGYLEKVYDFFLKSVGFG